MIKKKLHITKPPDSWELPKEKDNLLFDKLFENFDLDEIVFKIIISNNNYKTYTKRMCSNRKILLQIFLI